MSWFTSSYSGTSGNCVECRIIPGQGVEVRDSKRREGASLAFPAQEWRAFVAGVTGGEFDTR